MYFSIKDSALACFREITESVSIQSCENIQVLWKSKLPFGLHPQQINEITVILIMVGFAGNLVFFLTLSECVCVQDSLGNQFFLSLAQT